MPRLCIVTGLAASRRSVRPRLQHSLLELALVGIGMAIGTAQVLPVINFRRLRLEFGGFLVAVATGHRDVPSCQHKVSLIVTGQRE